MSDIKLWFEDFVKIDNDIWFASGTFNGLFKYNSNNGNTEFVSSFQGEEVLGLRLFSGIVHYENRLYFIPLHATRFYFFDLIDNSMHYIPNQYNEQQLLNLCCVYGDKIITVHNSEDYVLIYNMNNDKCEVIFDIKKNNDIDGNFVGKGVLLENRFYIGNSSNNTIISIDLDDMHVSSVKVGISNNKYYVIDVYEGGLLVKDQNSNVCLVRPDNPSLYVIGNVSGAVQDDNINSPLILIDENLYIFSFDKACISLYNLKNKSTYCINVFEDKDSINKINLIRQWGYVKRIGHTIYFNSNRDFSAYYLETNKLDEHNMRSMKFATKSNFFQYTNNNKLNQINMEESQSFQLEYYLMVLQEGS